MGFLDDVTGARPWSLPEGVPEGFTPADFHLGRGISPLEVAIAEAPRRPQQAEVRTLWKKRHGGTASPLLLAVLYPDGGKTRATICGPEGDAPAVISDLDPTHVERIARAALAEPTRHAASRLLVDTLAELESEFPVLRNEGMFATHELRTGVPQRRDWAAACERGRRLLRLRD